MAYDQLYEGLRDGLCDVAEGFSTDGRISAWGFQNLVDSKQFFPVYNASPIVRQEVLDQYPELEELLGDLGSYLDDDTIELLKQSIEIHEKTDGTFDITVGPLIDLWKKHSNI